MCVRVRSSGFPVITCANHMASLFARRTLLRGGAAALTFGATYALNSQADCAAIKAPQSLGANIPPTVVVKAADNHAKPELTLEYFCLRGLGELPRLILEVHICRE